MVVDLRKGLPTFLQWVSVELNGDNTRQLYIPKGFAHGFLTITDNVEFEYKMDNLYSIGYDRSIKYNDPSISIDWSELLNGISPKLSEKDLLNQLYIDSDCNFIYEDN